MKKLELENILINTTSYISATKEKISKFKDIY